MKKLTKLLTPLYLILLILLFSDTLYTRDFNITDTSWKYLGQPRPGMTPLRFPPDSLLANNSWEWHGTPVFSSDLKEMFWCKINHVTERGELAYIKFINGTWTPMQNAPFGNQSCWENCPIYFYTDDTLFFVSQRSGGFVFRTCRTSSGWTTPESINIPIPAGYTPGLDISIARNKTIYFDLHIPGQSATSDMYKSIFVNGQYQLPENLGNIVNSDSNESSPFIDPYERFIIFASKRPGGYGWHDIYISKRNPDDSWGNPINLGPAINSSVEDVFPYISPDGMYFFYVTGKNQQIGYNPFWVSAQYVYNLAAIGVNNLDSEIPGQYNLYQNYPNPFNPTTKIRFDVSSSPYGGGERGVVLKIYDILGREVAALVNEELNPGTYEVGWNAYNYPSGIYFYKLQTKEYNLTKKMILIK